MLKGVLGAVFGFTIALVFGIVSDVCRCLVDETNPILFDGDGILHGLFYAPMIAFFYLLIPVTIMGSLIGCFCFFIRTKIVLNPNSTD